MKKMSYVESMLSTLPCGYFDAEALRTRYFYKPILFIMTEVGKLWNWEMNGQSIEKSWKNRALFIHLSINFEISTSHRLTAYYSYRAFVNEKYALRVIRNMDLVSVCEKWSMHMQIRKVSFFHNFEVPRCQTCTSLSKLRLPQGPVSTALDSSNIIIFYVKWTAKINCWSRSSGTEKVEKVTILRKTTIFVH